VRVCNMELKISAKVSFFPPSCFCVALMSLLDYYGTTLDSVYLILQSGTKPSVLKYRYMGRKVGGYSTYLFLYLRKQFFLWSMLLKKPNKSNLQNKSLVSVFSCDF